MQLNIQHICVVVKNLEEAVERFGSLWGIAPSRVFDTNLTQGTVDGRDTYYSGRIAYSQAGLIELELLEPTEGDSSWSEFLRTKGEGVHHVGFFVPDLNSEVAKYKERGIRVLQTGESERVKFAFMDTEAIAGVIVEVLERK
jgi:methylmalonyl-CoA/ethylmalonyl-CoA epimerase